MEDRASPGTTHRFEYTVQAGEEDEFGPDILLNGLTTPTGSTITTTADGAAVLLGHRKVKGGAERHVDAVPPTLRAGSGDTAPVQVTGPTITVAWNEPLDETSVPAASRFTVTVTPMGDPAQTREVTEVSVAGKVVTLTLDRVAALSTSSTVTLSYAVPTTNPLRDLVGNNAAALDAQSVTVFGATNNVATARFTFENSDASVNVGDSMRVLAQITDADGFATDGKFTSRLLRVEGATETEIATKEESVDLAEGATTQRLTTPNYTLVRADAGKRLKLEVSFKDFADTEEMVASRTWPDDPIAWDTTACAMPSDIVNGSRKLVWTAHMTVGTFTDGGTTTGYGYASTLSGSSLSDTTLTIGANTYTIERIAADLLPGDIGIGLAFDLTTDLPTTQTGSLRLDICDEGTALSAAQYDTTDFEYTWVFSSGFDLSTSQTRRLYISRSDGTAPSLVSASVDGALLTLTYNEQLKRTNPSASGHSTPIQFAAVGKTFTTSNVRAGVGPRGRDVTVELSPAVRQEDSALGVLSYFYNDTTDATRIQDRAGNKAVAIDGYRSVVNVTRGGPGVARTTFANTGPYALGDTVEIDVVFSESVTVTGRPKLALEVGARRARSPVEDRPERGRNTALRVHRGRRRPRHRRAQGHGERPRNAAVEHHRNERRRNRRPARAPRGERRKRAPRGRRARNDRKRRGGGEDPHDDVGRSAR